MHRGRGKSGSDFGFFSRGEPTGEKGGTITERPSRGRRLCVLLKPTSAAKAAPISRRLRHDCPSTALRVRSHALTNLSAPLSRPEAGPVRAQRTRPHPESWRQRRRHTVEWRPAIAANFLLGALDAQPVPARGTSGTQTLHRRTRQILHRPPRFVSGPSAAAYPKCPRRNAPIPERMPGL
jgi:hypothetical protein